MKGRKTIIQANARQKGSAIVISDQILFNINKVRDTDEYYLLVKETTGQQALNISNIYPQNEGSAKFIKLLFTSLKKHIDENTIVVRDFNTQLLPLYRLIRQIN